MTKLIKHLFSAALGLLVLIGLSGTTQPTTVNAASKLPDNVEIVLHKLLFTELPSNVINDGTHRDLALEAGKPLNGVTFTAYDVTDDFWQRVDADATHDVEAVQQIIAQDSYDADAAVKKAAAKTWSVTTAGKGEAAFANLPLREHGHYAVYLFKETNQPEGITASQNLVVVLPGNLADETPGRIDLFPKNKMDHGYSEIEKTITNNRTNFGYGEPIPYQIAVKVPANIGALTSFKLTDTADRHLERIGGLTVKVDGQSAKGLYSTTRSDSNSFSLAFDVAKLIPFANKTITVTYQMRIKAGTTPDVPLVNNTVIYPGDDDPETDTAVVITGGKRFIKVDAKAHSAKLQGAVFVVRNAAGAYLTAGQDGWNWQTVRGDVARNYAGLHTLVSAKDGRFAITGLKAGAYQLVEVKAPAGYDRSTKAIPFAVVAGEYTRGQASPYTVVNVKTPTPPHEPNEPGIIGHLPQTGGEWAAWLSIMGLILIGLVAAIRVKTKKA
ncbi:SpaH/EbpB family LPXTG-anchored major pilin [Lacticaseibacillus daqingensis]|uniref:SpaH/EbpB family LPXTG-anchored major pilin n=1 Tax=Lacticaseibacillus daqingensis TaxID=2486014 RepID=UPI000F76BD97|nr:SpaH/EbpB family LPXTG-anchored major pilin [Lacticaseibacillus daqingensis]